LRTATLSENGVTTYEFSVYSRRRTEIYGYLDYEKAVIATMAQHILDLFIGETSFVVRHDCDFPGFEPSFLALILPVNLCVVSGVLIMATSGIGLDVRLTTDKGISSHLEPSQLGWFPTRRGPRHDLHSIHPYNNA
jgi:hypothetical protein